VTAAATGPSRPPGTAALTRPDNRDAAVGPLGMSRWGRHLGAGAGQGHGARPRVVVNADATGLVPSQFLRRDPCSSRSD
jgi:hypothetical protein